METEETEDREPKKREHRLPLPCAAPTCHAVTSVKEDRARRSYPEADVSADTGR
ncbi:MAG: hypothetical protein IJS01_13860 [Lentisphaeria bacterium]|nr:hypothetical protein [Lentisphaeria bacterium]